MSVLRSLWQWREWPERYGRIMASHTYVPQIDGLRFLAIMQVVIYHAAVRAQRLSDPGLDATQGWVRWWPNGVAGVELFFFISGYIIAYPFVSGRKPSLKAFYMRRLTRLEPPYILTVVLCGLAYIAAFGDILPMRAGHEGDAGSSVFAHLASSLVYAHGLVFQSSPPYNPPLWTLEIEIQFYVLAPFLIAAYLCARSTSARALVAVLCVLGGLALQAWLDPYAGWHYSLVTHIFAFALGVGFSDWASRTQPFARPDATWADALLAIGLVFFTVSSFLFYGPDSFAERFAVLALRCAGIVGIYLGAVRGRWGRRVFGLRWVAFIGGACYSIYLMHVPILDGAYRVFIPLGLEGQPVPAVFLTEFVLLPITTLACLVFYILVERPCMRADWPQNLWRRLVGRRQEAAR